MAENSKRNRMTPFSRKESPCHCAFLFVHTIRDKGRIFKEGKFERQRSIYGFELKDTVEEEFSH